MHQYGHHLVTSIQTVCLIVFIGLIIFVANKTELKRIINEKKWQHIFFGSIVAVSFLWLFRVSIYDGLVMHFLWLTTLTLVLGYRWAILAGAIVLLISTAIGNDAWSMIGVNGLIGVAVPITVTYLIFSWAFHKLPKHLFVYIFICAFIPGAISVGLKMLFLSGYYYVDGVYPWDVIEYNYLMMSILMVLQESFFNGFSITCLVVYKPDLVHTYHDKFYLDGK